MEPTHYVVLHTRVGLHFVAGEVVDRRRLVSALAPLGDEAGVLTGLARLVARGAVRPASEQEAGMSRVTLVEVRPLSFEMALAEKVALMTSLEEQLAASHAEQVRLRSMAVPTVARASLEPLERVELRQAIDELQRKHDAQVERVAELEAELAEAGRHGKRKG